MAPSAAPLEKAGPGHAPEAPAPVPRAEDLHVGPADDQYERAADRAADEVVRRLAATGELGGHATAGPAAQHAAPVGPEGGAVQERTAAAIRRSSGAPLPGTLRTAMEGAMGSRLGSVRLHTGPQAAALSAELGAQAFTVGKDVFLGAGAPALDTRQGQHLLAHELAHTQQDSGGAQRAVRRKGRKTALLSASLGTMDATSRPASAATPKAGGAEVALDSAGKVGDITAPLADPGGVKDFHEAKAKAEGKEAEVSALGSSVSLDSISNAGAAMTSFGFLVSAAQAIAAFRSATPDRTEQFEAVLGTVNAATSTSAALAGVTKTAQGGDGTTEVRDVMKDGKKVLNTDGTAKTVTEKGVGAAPEVTQAASNILNEIAGIVGTLEKGYQFVKACIKLAEAKEDLEKGLPAVETVDAMRALLAMGKGLMETINAFYGHLGTVTGAMVSAVPGLGIALGVLDMLRNGLAFAEAYTNYGPMRTEKQSAKAALFGALDMSPKAKTFWGGNASADEEVALIRGGKWLDLSAKCQTQDVRLQVWQNADRHKELVGLADEYENVKLLQTVNGKRMKRQMLNISTGLPSLAGDIAILSGAGAAAGVGLKVAGSGSKGLATLFRMGKQLFNDHSRFGDKSKSSGAKLAAYDKLIESMVNSVVQANDRQDAAEREAALGRATARVEASGLPSRALRAAAQETDRVKAGKELWASWVSALKERG